jgi:hypothetical protein
MIINLWLNLFHPPQIINRLDVCQPSSSGGHYHRNLHTITGICNKVLNPGLKGYSCLTILSDGIIKCFVKRANMKNTDFILPCFLWIGFLMVTIF